MKELLECTDLLANERVIKAYWGLKGGGYDHRIEKYGEDKTKTQCVHDLLYCAKCSIKGRKLDASCPVPDLIPGSVADVAFAMRDALGDSRDTWQQIMRLIASGMWPDDHAEWVEVYSQPEHWIIAAVLAWEATQ